MYIATPRFRIGRRGVQTHVSDRLYIAVYIHLSMRIIEDWYAIDRLSSVWWHCDIFLFAFCS
jgi:hypothetical protein